MDSDRQLRNGYRYVAVGSVFSKPFAKPVKKAVAGPVGPVAGETLQEKTANDGSQQLSICFGG